MAVLADYKKPEPKKPETWPDRFKLIMAGIEAFRLKNDWPVKFFCEEKLEIKPANYYTMRSGGRVISEVTAKKLALRIDYTLDELEEEGRNSCLPFLWAVHEHPKATGRCIWTAAVLAAIWGDNGRGI